MREAFGQWGPPKSPLWWGLGGRVMGQLTQLSVGGQEHGGGGAGGAGLGFQLGHLAAVLLWVCYLTSLSPH